MLEVTSLEFLLSLDAENVMVSKNNVKAYVPDFMEGIESFVAAFGAVAREWSVACGYDARNEEMQRWLKDYSATHGTTAAEAFRFLRDANLIGSPRSGDTTTDAQSTVHDAVAILARTQITLRLNRDFQYGVSDLLRLRASAATIHVRLQCESAALTSLMQREPSAARDWFDGLSPDGGDRFYKAWGRKISKEIKRLGLRRFYEEGSNTAAHSRVGGVIRGVLIGGKSRDPREIKISYQDFDDPKLLLFAFVPYLAFHCELLRVIDKLYPEMKHDQFGAMDRDACFKFYNRVREKAMELHAAMGKAGILIALGGHEVIGA